MARWNSFTPSEKKKIVNLEAKRDKATKRGKHTEVIEAEREIREIHDGAADRQ
jgi:hypothetical protein